MKLYSDYAGQRGRQVFADVFAIGSIVMWVVVGWWLYDLVNSLQSYGVRMEQAGADFRTTLADIGADLGSVPLIGDGIRVPFDAAAGAGAELEAAGIAQQEAVANLALGVGVGVAALPVATVLLLWLLPRIRFARRARAATALAEAAGGTELLALRAIANQKLTTLFSVHRDPAGAWRRGDQEVLRALASLELRSAGVRLP